MYHNILYENAVKDTQSGDSDKVISGIKALRESGKPEAVTIVIGILRDCGNDSVVKECVRFLNDMKDPKAINPLMDGVKEPLNKDILHHLVSCAWQNDLDYTQHLDDFIDVLLYSNYLAAFEAFTVIENQLEKLSSDDIRELGTKIESQLDKVTEEKRTMISELTEMIHNWPNQ